jgi:hypothetical protein
MAVVALFEVKGLTSSKYDEVVRRLTALGQRIPNGQRYHICYGDKDNLQVIDVFESQAALDAFFPTIKPILDELGVEVKPNVLEVNNLMF